MSEPPQVIEVRVSIPFGKWVRKTRLRAAVDRLTMGLRANPFGGDVVPGSGGIRKVRMAGGGRGKRGGFRVIYTVVVDSTVLLLLDGYSKSEQDDVTADDLKRVIAEAKRMEAEIVAERALPSGETP